MKKSHLFLTILSIIVLLVGVKQLAKLEVSEQRQMLAAVGENEQIRHFIPKRVYYTNNKVDSILTYDNHILTVDSVTYSNGVISTKLVLKK